MAPCSAQQVLFTEGFEGAQPAFALNTTDLGGVAAGDNKWLVNAMYTGGDGTLDCMGIPFTYTIPATAAQPAGIGDANGRYLHISSQAGLSSGIQNCNFAAADGLCTSAASHFARMTADVSTVGATEATLSFWWLCAGGPNSFGELYYSTDAGNSWNLVAVPVAQYRNQSSWAQQVVSLPVFAGQATLRFGFRFVNNVGVTASDPAFGIDDVQITSTQQEVALATGDLAYSTYCPGSVLQVPFTASGPWNTGNVFTAELSDMNGAFTAPVAIGSLSGTASGAIPASIPAGTATGTGYRVRVTGSNPALVADLSATVITIAAAPYAGQDTHISFCSNDAPQTLLNFMPGAADCGSWTAPGGGPMGGILYPASAPAGPYTYTTDCPVGCPQDQAVLLVGIIAAPDAGVGASMTICANEPPFALLSELGGTPDAGGTWASLGVPMNGVFVPGTTPQGCFTYTVQGISPCAAEVSMVCVTVDDCAGIARTAQVWPGLRWVGQSGLLQLIGTGGLRPDQVEMYDASGRPVAVQVRPYGQDLLMDLAGAAGGVYLVRLVKGELAGTVRLVHQP